MFTGPCVFFYVHKPFQDWCFYKSYGQRPLNSSSLQYVREEYKDVFTGLGKFDLYIITVEDGADPVIHPQGRVSHGLHDRLKEKLDQMERDEIITKVDKPTIWVNSLAILEKKDDSLRLWLYPKDANKLIRRKRFQFPTF